MALNESGFRVTDAGSNIPAARFHAAEGEEAVGTPKTIVRQLKGTLASGKSEGSFRKGGLVIPKNKKPSGNFKLHKGERVVPATKKSKAQATALQSGIAALAKPGKNTKKK
jgi:hypothetical protein